MNYPASLAILLLTPLAALYAADAPALAEPPDGAMLTMSIPHFQWQRHQVADVAAMPAYDIQIASDEGFNRVVDEDRLAAVITRYVPDKELAPGDYWWRVVAVDGKGERGTWSAARRFAVRRPERVVEIPKRATFADIQRAFAEATTHSPAMVRFEKGDHRLDPGGAAAFISFTNASDLVIDGGGGSFTFTGFLKFVKLEHCRRVMVRNFTFDFDPLPYTAGRVLAVNAKTGTFEVEIASGHPLPESNPHFERDKKGMIVDPRFPRMKQGATLIFEHAGWQKLAERRYRFTAASPRQLRELAPGDVYVLDPRIATGFDVDACDEVVFYNLTAHAIANEGFNSHYGNRHSILHCGIRLKPGRFIAANNGGHNHHNARIGPWIEGCTWENTGDDICHVNCLVLGVEEKLAPDRVRLPLRNPYDAVGPGVALDIQPGDVLQFFNRAEGRLVSERKIVSTATLAKSLDVTLDGDVGDIVPGRPSVKRVGLKKVPADGTITQVFNASRTCNQFVFRHNTVRNGRRIGVLAKGRGGLVENNTFEGLGGGAVEFWNAPFEGLGAMDYVVRGNRIRDCGRLAREHAAIWATIFKSGADRLHRNLLITGNEITGFPAPAILLRDAENVVVRDNRIAVAPSQSEPITLQNTASVRLQSNIVKDSPLHAAEFSFDNPPGPQFTDAEKQAQRERGASVVPMVRKAFEAGVESVTIPPSDYRFDKEKWGKGGPVYPLEFRGMKRDAAKPFRIIAKGVTFWFDLPPDQAPHAHFALGFVDCSHLALEGATLDRDPRGCMEGRITQFDDAGNRIEIEATKGTLVPANFSGKLEQRLVPFNADGTFCTALYALQHKGPARLTYRGVEPGSQPGRYWVNLHEKSELLKINHALAWCRAYGDAGALQPGDGLSLVYSTTTAIGVTDCAGMKFIGVKNYITKGMVRELGGGGGHLWKDCYFGPRPGTCHWQGSDGFLSGCMERGSTLDGCTMLHTTDDVMNINGFWGYIEKAEGNTIVIQRDHQMPAQTGDRLNFFDKQTGEPLGTAVVESVDQQTLTINRAAAPLANAIAENPRWQNNGWEIRNCVFRDCYQRLLVQGGNGGTLRDCRFTRVGSSVQLHSNFFTKNEGGICRGIRIVNNTFEDVAMHPDGVTLHVGFQSLNKQARTPLLSDITVRGNRFINSGKRAIEFNLVSGGDISGNTFVNSGMPRVLAGRALPDDDTQPVQLKDCAGTKVGDNRVRALEASRIK